MMLSFRSRAELKYISIADIAVKPIFCVAQGIRRDGLKPALNGVCVTTSMILMLNHLPKFQSSDLNT